MPCDFLKVNDMLEVPVNDNLALEHGSQRNVVIIGE